MRTNERQDPAFQPLGQATPKPAPTVPTTQPTSTPGVVRMPDGKLATQLPLPKAAA